MRAVKKSSAMFLLINYDTKIAAEKYGKPYSHNEY